MQYLVLYIKNIFLILNCQVIETILQQWGYFPSVVFGLPAGGDALRFLEVLKVAIIALEPHHRPRQEQHKSRIIKQPRHRPTNQLSNPPSDL